MQQLRTNLLGHKFYNIKKATAVEVRTEISTLDGVLTASEFLASLKFHRLNRLLGLWYSQFSMFFSKNACESLQN